MEKSENKKNHIYVKVKISDELQKAFLYGSKKVKEQMQKELVRIGTEAQERIQRSMQNTGKAHWFYRKPNGAIHWPSAPGYPPAIDSGRLWNSIQIDVGEGRIEIGSETGKGDAMVNYALPLEEGTDFIKARPFVEPVAEWVESVIEERLWKSAEDYLY